MAAPSSGRVQTVHTESGDLSFDGGAEFIGPTRNHVQVLADEYGVTTLPIGPIHWAGTESAIHWQGYMDGAVTAGYRADEVAAALS